MKLRHLLTIALLSLASLAWSVMPAFADTPPDPPVNDSLATPTVLTFPQKVTGTTLDSTIEALDPYTQCPNQYGSKGSVWYSLTGVSGNVALSFTANGDLDVIVDVFTRDRSDLLPVECEASDRNGLALVTFDARASHQYLIRISQKLKSLPDTFTLEVARAAEPATAPGKRLPAKGISDSVNYALNPSDAWSVKVHAGTTYRVNIRSSNSKYCIKAFVYSKNQFGGVASVALDCKHGYSIFTPGHGKGGRYTIFVQGKSKVFGNQRYHLEFGRAKADDTAPGEFWNSNSRRGSLSGGGIDVVDLYNWDLRRTAIVELALDADAGFKLQLLNAQGNTIRCACSGDESATISKRLKPGQYFVAVRADEGQAGKYRLKRVDRTITRTAISVGGKSETTVAPGESVSINTTVTPAVVGIVDVTLQRLDPIDGWQFERHYEGSIAGGSFNASFVPPGVGRWRVRAVFKGTGTANRSKSRYSRIIVRRP